MSHMSDREDPMVIISRHGRPQPEAEEPSSCSPKAYVSNEEAAIAAAMHDLRQQAEQLREQLESAAEKQRSALEKRLEQLRERWQELAVRRDQANTRKMIMLGHLPPDAEGL